MTTLELLARALSATGQHSLYGLGKGGYDPLSQWPWSAHKECDCSGFVAWALGVSRNTDHPWYKQFNGGWLETSAVARDALESGGGMFELVAWKEARPGQVLVYGDSAGHQGHIGIVTGCGGDGPITAVHCSKGNQARFHDAIQETDVLVWKDRGGIVARCILVDAA